MKIEPYHNNVVIEQEDESELTYGSIIVPDSGKEKPFVGKVIAVGPGIINMMGTLVPMTAKVGKRVAFPSFGGQKLSVNGKDYLIYKDPDLFCGIEDELSDLPSSLPKDLVNELMNIEETITIPRKEYDLLTSEEIK